MPFRKALIWIKRQHTEHRKNLFLYSALAILVLGGGAFVMDMLLPWNQVAIFLRALFALPLGVALFVFTYANVISHVDRRRSEDVEREYLTLREKMSPTMRVRLSFIFAAILFVLMFAVAQVPGYTFTAGAIMACVLGIFTFTRKTSDELRRANIGIPDARDAVFEAQMREKARNVAQSKRAKERADQKIKDQTADLKAEENLEK